MIINMGSITGANPPRNVAVTDSVNSDGEDARKHQEGSDTPDHHSQEGSEQDGAQKDHIKEAGTFMAKQLAGNTKSDDALGRLLNDLDKLDGEPSDATTDIEPPSNSIARTVSELEFSPFKPPRRFDSEFIRVTTIYEWGLRMFSGKESFKPGIIYSDRF